MAAAVPVVLSLRAEWRKVLLVALVPLALVLFAVTLIGVPVLLWRRWDRDPVRSASLGYIWISTVYVLGLGVFVDFGENQRFRYDLGQLPLAAAATVVAAVVFAGRRRVRPSRAT